MVQGSDSPRPERRSGRAAEPVERINALAAESAFRQADRLIHTLCILDANGYPGYQRGRFHGVADGAASIGIAIALSAEPDLSDEEAIAAGEQAARTALAAVAAEYVQRPDFPQEAVRVLISEELHDALLADGVLTPLDIRHALDAAAWEALLAVHPGGTPDRVTVTPLLRRALTSRLTPSAADLTDAGTTTGTDHARRVPRAEPNARETLGHWKFRTVRDLIGDALLARPEPSEDAARDDASPNAREIPVERAGMSVRTANALLRVGVHSLGDAARLTANDLRQIPHFGDKALREVSETLGKYGLGGPAQSEPASPATDEGRRATSGRNAEILALRRQGLSLAEIASRYGLSRERVRQITSRSMPSADAAEARRAQQLAAAEAASDELRAGFRGGSSAAELAKALGLATAAVESVLRSTPTAFDRAERRRRLADRRHAGPRYSDGDLLRAVKQVAERVGGVPSSNDYRQFAGELGLPSLPTVMNRFGGWGEAVRGAGMTPHVSRRSGYSRRWTEDACRRALEALVAELGEMPTAAQYDVLASADDSLPSVATVRNRLGRWSEVAAGLMAMPHSNPTLRHLGVSSEASDSERDEAVWLAHLAGEVSDAEIIELMNAGLFTWDPSYESPPDV